MNVFFLCCNFCNFWFLMFIPVFCEIGHDALRITGLALLLVLGARWEEHQDTGS